MNIDGLILSGPNMPYENGEKLDAPYAFSAWLSTDGTMYFVPDGGAHEYVAGILINDLDDSYADSRLIQRGWLRLSRSMATTSHYVTGDAPFECIKDCMTQAQVDTLFDILRSIKDSPVRLFAVIRSELETILFGQ